MSTELEVAVNVFGLTFGRTRVFGVSYVICVERDRLAWFKIGRGNNSYQRGTFLAKLPCGFESLPKLEQIEVIEQQIVPMGADNSFEGRPATLKDSDVQSECPKEEEWRRTIRRFGSFRAFKQRRKELKSARSHPERRS